MIPVVLAPEPASFDAKVRKKGEAAMRELIGKGQPRRGRPRAPVAKRRDRIPSDKFPPFWRDVLDEMHKAYEGRCAYLAMYIEKATGNPSVDHVIPRSRNWRQVYAWSNYRLAAALINSKKNDLELVLDPVAIGPGWFALDFLSMEVVQGPAVSTSQRTKVQDTIDTLGLNLQDCIDQRGEYYGAYKSQDISLGWLERRAPFIAQELRRQGKLNPGDA